MAEKRLYLIDGNSLLYRSYYAIRHLTNSKGFPTNAIYGFITTIKKLIEQQKPHFFGIVFDTKGPTIRHEAFKDYKAHRKPMPEDLSIQIPVLKKIIKAMNIPYFELEKYEADDVLGSLAQKASKHEIHSIIVTTDKDLLQLVNKSITIFNPVKDVYLDEKKVKEDFGVAPSQVVDVLALWGDQSDNIPGVPGIGEKTSKALINRFGTLKNMLENLDLIEKASLREKITNNMESLNLSLQLVTIEKELEVNINLEDIAVSDPEYKELIPLYQELEFSSLLTEFMKKSDKNKKKYSMILEESQLQDLISQINKKKSVSLDTETDSSDPMRARLVGISFSLEPDHAFYLPLRHDYPSAPKQLSKEKAFSLLETILTDASIKKIGQNIKYDYIVLKREGITLQGLDLDTMILSYLIEPNWGKHNLNHLAMTYLEVQTIAYHDIVGRGKKEVTMNAVNVEKVTPYACQDADLAMQLSSLLLQKVKENNLSILYREVELPLIEVLADMEMIGIMVDSKALKELSAELQEELNRLKAKVFEICDEEFNMNSPQQLAHILFEKLKLPTSRRTRVTKGFSTSFDILQELSQTFPVAKYALEYRQMAKLRSTYANALPHLINPETGRIHTSYNQSVAATGRLSSSNPNLQNIPIKGELGQRFRQAFIPASGHLFLAADYSQIELRVLAHLSEDKALIETFCKNHDVHQETAARVFGDSTDLFSAEQRRRAKVINFSLIYGTSAFSLAKELGTTTSEAQQFIDLYFEKYPKVQAFLDASVTTAKEKGFSETLFGRKRPVPELRHRDKIVQQAGRRIALNTPIQGTAADLMKKAMIDIWHEIRKENLKSKMILQVHDELVFEVPENECDELEAIVIEKMEKVYSLKIPLKVHVGWGINWAEAK